MDREIFFGIDFSGGAAPWKARCSRPTVWIATLEGACVPRLVDLRPVQALPGHGTPFFRLTALLSAGDYTGAGIDAPFSIPAANHPQGGQAELLERIAALPPAGDRPFPSGADMLALVETIRPLGDKKKPLRSTEADWAKCGVNTRSTLWNGPRGGAPFTAACLTLLARASRPVWPWNYAPGMLVEAFPAAQLHVWGLPHGGYAKPEQEDKRKEIVVALAERLTFSKAQCALMTSKPDALDAVIAAFAPIAAVQAGVLEGFPPDGLIGVLDHIAPQADKPRMLSPSGNCPQSEIEVLNPERFEDLLCRPGVRIERILSAGHITPPDQPYVQGWDEWVIVLEGAARLSLAGEREITLAAGEHLLIPAGVPHLVTYTADPTVWLAVHIGEP